MSLNTPRLPLRVGLTGGIGSGKSTVSRLLQLLGIPVYNADLAARQLMENDPSLQEAIIHHFGPESYITENQAQRLNRPYLANRVFGHPERLAALNRLVHPAVERDFERWAAQWDSLPSPPPYVVEEAAILIESGAHRLMDRIVTVTAPEPIRLQRIIRRDRTTATAARARISAQLSDPQRASYADFTLTADDRQLLIPQVLALHTALCRETAGESPARN
ncbi:dephospho-CoA kinase [uncultured Rikenella sp.]|uniref:dephospho-CoA kinase n=1 Tax=uncultured Rikenella sp. TaxID=368003 RepID=UPI0025F4FD8D|nr:dephospho-CoA kinase [uncultured Rikenella sp.]